MNVSDFLYSEYREISMDEPRPHHYRTIEDVDREFEDRLRAAPEQTVADNAGADRAVVYGEFEVPAIDAGRCDGCDNPNCRECNRVGHDTLQREVRTARGGGSRDKKAKKVVKATKQSEKNDEQSEGKTERWQVFGLTLGEKRWYEHRRSEALMVLRQQAARIQSGDGHVKLEPIPGRRPKYAYCFSVYGLTDDELWLLHQEPGTATAVLVQYARRRAGGWIDNIDRRLDPAVQTNAFGTPVTVAA